MHINTGVKGLGDTHMLFSSLNIIDVQVGYCMLQAVFSVWVN